MQALSNFTWIPSLMQNQTAHHHTPYMHQENMACTKPRPSMVTDFSFLKNSSNNSKRKRTDSWGSTTNNTPVQESKSPATKKQKSDVATPVQSKSQASLSQPVWQVAPQQNQCSTQKQQVQTDIAGDNASKSTATAPSSSTSDSASTGPLHFAHSSSTSKTAAPSRLPCNGTPSIQPADPLPPKSRKQMPLKLKDTPEAKVKAQEIVESQLNLEILLKHQELRLIEQELAKCQVSLEQIRRCQIIPYPGQDGSPATHEQISTGSGSALAPTPGLTRPRHPAPWGVTDGPYTRHYAKWLIPDGTFDSTLVAGRGSGISGSGLRSTRGSYFDPGSAVSSRYHRGSVGSKFHSLPANYTAPPKDRHGPLIIKRPSDGQMVKLICKFCQKDNISSVQGFLNHCRIAHQKSYESHGEAAEECGIAMDANEANAALTTPTTEQISQKLPSQHAQQQHSTSMPVLSTPTSAVASPFAGKPFVHPLITQQQQPPQASRVITLGKPKVKATSARGPALKQDLRGGLSTISPADNSISFVPSLQTPKLSALLQKRGITGNLSRLVTDSQQKCNIDEIQYIGGEECVEDTVEDVQAQASLAGTQSSRSNPALVADASILEASQQQHGGRVPSRGGPSSKLQINSLATTVPVGKSGIDKPLSLKPTPFDNDTCASSDNDCSQESGMSPHTIDTNPGLTEDEAYGPGEDSDDQDGHSTLTDRASPSTEAMDVDVDVEVRDFGEHAASNMRNGMRRHSGSHDEHEPHDVKAPPPPSSPRVNGNAAVSTTKSTVPVKRKRGRPAKDRKGSVDSTAASTNS